MITVLGHAGAGGTNVDYQIAGLVGYKIKPTVILQLGWRYLDANYRSSFDFYLRWSHKRDIARRYLQP
jgi:hypothetical protein